MAPKSRLSAFFGLCSTKLGQVCGLLVDRLMVVRGDRSGMCDECKLARSKWYMSSLDRIAFNAATAVLGSFWVWFKTVRSLVDRFSARVGVAGDNCFVVSRLEWPSPSQLSLFAGAMKVESLSPSPIKAVDDVSEAACLSGARFEVNLDI